MENMIVIVCGPKRPLPPPLRRFLKWFMCAFVLVVCVYEARVLFEILGRPATQHRALHHAH